MNALAQLRETPTTPTERLAYIRRLLVEIARASSTVTYAHEGGKCNTLYRAIDHDNGDWIQIVTQEVQR